MKTILLVDDDQVNNFINEKLLSRLNIADEVKVVTNGLDGINCLEDHCFKTKISPELILLDINMPVMNGFEFMSKFHSLDFSNKNEVIIAVLTTSSHEVDKEKMEKLGIKYFIIKPLTEEKVKNLLKSFQQEKNP